MPRNKALLFPYLSKVFLLALVYFIAGKLGLMLAFVHRSATPVWAPTGITLTAFLLLGYRYWPGILLGAFTVNLFTEGSWLTSLGIGIGNTLEGLAGAYLVNRFAMGRHAFNRAQTLFKFVFLAGLVSTAISPTLGLSSLALGGFVKEGAHYLSIWLTWWLGDVGGNLILAPLLLLWFQNPQIQWSSKQRVEFLCLLIVLIGIGFVVFGALPFFHTKNYPLEFATIPPLLWASFRFGKREAATAIFVLCIIAIWGTLGGFGPFVTRSLNESLLLLEAYMGVISLMTLVLAAVLGERNEAAIELNHSYEKLKKMDQVKSDFILAASHELRTPLTSMKGYLSLLLDHKAGPVNEQQKEFINYIQSATDRLHRLLSELLNLSKIESGQVSLNREEVPIADLLRGELAIFKAEADQKKIHLELVIENDLGKVFCDQDKINQVLVNLISNALKYTPKGGKIRILARRENKNIFIEVKDTGIGINPEDHLKIFLPFQHIRKEGLRGEESNGLGLALAKRIVEVHKGEIHVESQEGVGSRFWILLPL